MIGFQQFKILVRQFLDRPRQRPIASPKFGGGEMLQSSRVFPARWEEAASADSLPVRASRSIWRSQAAES